jgi:hypothetical protein
MDPVLSLIDVTYNSAIRFYPIAKSVNSLLPIGSHIEVCGIKPYGFDYKIGDKMKKNHILFSFWLSFL